MKAENPETGGRRNVIVLAVLAVVIIGIITAVLIYANKVAPFQATVLVVDGTSVKMGYFLKRASIAGTTPSSMLQTLVTEEVVKQIAPQMPYNIKISEEEIDQALREMAASAGESETIDEADFESWYRRELKGTRFSNSEYREIVRTNLMRFKLTLYLEERIPTVAEQVRLYLIAQGSYDGAVKVKQRLDAGEDFLEVARELAGGDSADTSDFDLGWVPRTLLPEDMARAAFERLKVGQYSEPILVNQQYFAIIMVLDRAAARLLDEQALAILKSSVFDRWLQQEMAYHKVAVHGLNNGYDGETEAWIQWQLQDMRK